MRGRQCGFDNGECLKCSPGCPLGALNNGVCDAGCMTANCSYDAPDCPQHIPPTPSNLSDSPRCPLELGAGSALGNGQCDSLFNIPECACDHGDCADSTAGVGRYIFRCHDGALLEAADVCDGVANCASSVRPTAALSPHTHACISCI